MMIATTPQVMKGNAANTPKENDLDVSSQFLTLKGILRYAIQEDAAGKENFRQQSDLEWRADVQKEFRRVGIKTKGRLGALLDTVVRVKNAIPRSMTKDKILKVQEVLHDPKAHLMNVSGADKEDPKFIQRLCDVVVPLGVDAVLNTGEVLEPFFDRHNVPEDQDETNSTRIDQRNLPQRRAGWLNAAGTLERLAQEQQARELDAWREGHRKQRKLAFKDFLKAGKARDKRMEKTRKAAVKETVKRQKALETKKRATRQKTQKKAKLKVKVAGAPAGQKRRARSIERLPKKRKSDSKGSLHARATVPYLTTQCPLRVHQQVHSP